MSLAFGAMLASGGALLLLAMMYRIEEASQRRLLGGVRSWCDRRLTQLRSSMAAGIWQEYVTAIRWYFYRLLHIVLRRCLRLVSWIATSLEIRLRRNRAKAKQLTETDGSAYLRSLHEHKEASVLSERERQHRRRFH